MSPRSRRVWAAFAAAIVTVLSVQALSAHDFWIVPNAFEIASGASVEVRGQTSTKFPTSEVAVGADRVADARLIAASEEEPIKDLSVSGKSLLLRHQPSAAGQRVVAVALVTRTSRAAAAGLKRYIALEGAPELAERYEREGLFQKADSVTQRTTKYAKTIVEVGRDGPRAFSRTAGHALEFVPLSDPTALRAGDTVMVRLLFHGNPLANAHMHIGVAPPEGDTTRRVDLSAVTSADGVARVPLDHPGLWNVRTLHAAPAETASGEWEVTFATMVFRVSERAGADGAAATPTSRRVESARDATLPNQGTDSAAAAATVEHFHAALAAGDSAGALAVLAPDAVILESGGVETRDEYRSHHLPGDIGFAQAIKSQRGPMHVAVRGDVAWVSATSVTQGDYRGRPINSAGAELVVLSRDGGGWKIRAIHWSSRTRRPS